ncbi:glycerol-3-phosphate dehydrogenase [Methylobacterium isbiliense]|uniref:Glycerol-3-phosphate dehydrogenase n=1 Tax=Methylobacterium isbiliense TaxID=315478 RepID=A0ABQ4S609_9HYPH|nr:glycerol-3-phosphate dehydrogenase [Methylobacterium isbiliense]MDN3626293.1 glycerol-3-phosphate dehydrogenase [Methylobacterium isbiliense]GJD98586.1 D-erythritol 1-phosphate dehydrogenase [Methylobacterium isbiliense]
MSLRREQPGLFDLAVIGGGINGCGIARDAAGRGASVVLFEQNDLGSGTSSASTKLIHGGLRYLEHHEFRLVRESLMEREVLWGMAPHIVWPLRFVLPHHAGLRPAWLLRLGLFLYDHLGGRRRLPGTRTLDLARDPAGAPLKPGFGRAFEYSDCWVEDSRLVVLNARDAAARGAVVRPRTRVVGATRLADRWEVAVEEAGGRRETVQARVLVNAAGPWVADVLTGVVRANTAEGVRLVQGSHIVVRRLFAHDRAYIFQNADGRIVFAIPYERDFTLIGTTDRDYRGDPAAVSASEEEIAYLCAAASEYFREQIRREDVVWTYSGVRPLYDDGATKAQEATRDYVLTLDAGPERAALLSVFGGKITTYRRLAEAALERLRDHLPAARRPAWTRGAGLPGGDFPVTGYDDLVAQVRREHPYLAPAHAARLVRAYGTDAREILQGARTAADLGRVFGADLTEREVRYLMRREWAMRADDVLWRRTKLGLRLDPAEAAALDAFMRGGAAASSAA